MLNNLLAIVQGDGSSWAGQTQSPNNYYFDNWGEPFLYALIGFLVVFAGILIIIFTIWLVGLLMKKTNNLEFLGKGKKKKATVVESKPEAPQAATAADDGEIPDEVKAAIIAAIMAYYEEKQEKCDFTVKRIKRI
ncbi:MAG: OadG family protein [Candidatus Coproplasma sp.]